MGECKVPDCGSYTHGRAPAWLGVTHIRSRNRGIPAAGDYRLREDSPAFTIPAFVDLPFPQMGIIDGLSLIFENGFEWGDTSRWEH